MATKFYFPLDAAAAVSPAVSAEWEHQETIVRRKAVTAVGLSTLGTVAVDPDSADHIFDYDVFHRQYVTDPLTAQTIASQTVTAQFQCIEAHASNNLRLTIKIFLVSEDGQTIGDTLLAITRAGTEPTTALRNTSFSATTTERTCTAGQRLVFEIGLGGLPTSGSGINRHNGSIRWGEVASSGDLPIDETQAGTTYRPWLNFANTLTFVPQSQTMVGSTAASMWTVVAQTLVVGAVALSGLAASAAGVVPAQTLVAGPKTLAGAAAATTWAVPAQTLNHAATPLVGAAASSGWVVPAQAVVSASRVADVVVEWELGVSAQELTGAAASTAWVVPAQTLAIVARALTGAAASAVFVVPAQTLGQNAIALTGAVPVATWGLPAQVLVRQTTVSDLVVVWSAEQVLSGNAPSAVWVVPAQTLVGGGGGPQSLVGAAASSVAGFPTHTLLPGAVACVGSAGVATWVVPAQSLVARTALVGTPANAAWIIPTQNLVISARALSGAGAIASWIIPAQQLLARNQLTGLSASATWAVVAQVLGVPAHALAGASAVAVWVIPTQALEGGEQQEVRLIRRDGLWLTITSL